MQWWIRSIWASGHALFFVRFANPSARPAERDPRDFRALPVARDSRAFHVALVFALSKKRKKKKLIITPVLQSNKHINYG